MKKIDHSKKKHKHNLILIQAYPANSLLSEGIIRYLEDYFHLYFIDLPGFIRNVDPLDTIELKGFTRYIEGRIKELDLDEYILGGISFGALLANYVRVDDRCKAILSAEPYLGYKYIKIQGFKRYLLLAVLSIIIGLRLEDKIWKTKFFYNYLDYSSNLAKKWIKILHREVDARTFFRTGKLLLTFDDKRPNFHDKPYILLINPDDMQVDFSRVIHAFRENINNDYLRIIISELEHYPDTPTYHYFKETITGEELNSLIGFLEYIEWFDPNIKVRKKNR